MAGFMDRRSKRSYHNRFPLNRQKEKIEAVARAKKDDDNRHERMHEKVDKDDFLLAQIDEFREKAQKLQQMLDTKETKAQELADIVEQRELKAEELKQILDERQIKADGITAQVEHQIDILIERVNAKMHEIEESMSQNMTGFTKSLSDNMGNLEKSISDRLDNAEQSVEKNITDISKNIDFSEAIEKSQKVTEDNANEIKTVVNEANTNMLKSLSELNEQLIALKQEISEKVHTENVKCYRNIQDLFKAMDVKVDSVYAVEKHVKSTRVFSILAFVFTMINTVGIAAIVLYMSGIFDRIFG